MEVLQLIQQQLEYMKAKRELPYKVIEGFKYISWYINQNIPATSVYIYGSYHWGNWHEESDYDIMIDKVILGANMPVFKLILPILKIALDTKVDIMGGTFDYIRTLRRADGC